MNIKVYIFLFSLISVAINAFSQQFIEVKSIKQSTRDYSEFGANYFEDGIVYCSNKRENIIISRQSSDNQSFYNVYFVSKNRKSKKQNTEFLSASINKLYNDGPLTSNGSVTVFAQNYDKKKSLKDEKTNVGLFVCNKINNVWSEPVPFPFNDEKYNLSYPSINKEGNALYFSADLAGGFGKYDIYVSYFKDGKWTSPQNVGKEINTSGNEISPFIFQNSRLYFSTDNFDSTIVSDIYYTDQIATGVVSHVTKTFDIYYSDYINNQWQKPFRLPEPINSSFNDFAFVCDSTTENGYFTSDRKGNDDIFKFFSTLPAFETCDSMLEKNYCYHFVEGKTVDLDTIPVIYEWDFGDSTKVKSFEADHCFPGPGAYNVSLNMIDTITGDIYKMIASYLLSVDDPIGPYIVCADTAKVNVTIDFDASQTNMPENKIDQYIWLFSDKKKFIGQKIVRSFEKPGIYRINLGVTFDKDKSGNYQKKCMFKDIVVE